MDDDFWMMKNPEDCVAVATWNTGGASKDNDVSMRQPNLPSLMPGGSKTKSGLLNGAKKRILGCYCIKTFESYPCFNLVLE